MTITFSSSISQPNIQIKCKINLNKNPGRNSKNFDKSIDFTKLFTNETVYTPTTPLFILHWHFMRQQYYKGITIYKSYITAETSDFDLLLYSYIQLNYKKKRKKKSKRHVRLYKHQTREYISKMHYTFVEYGFFTTQTYRFTSNIKRFFAFRRNFKRHHLLRSTSISSFFFFFCS